MIASTYHQQDDARFLHARSATAKTIDAAFNQICDFRIVFSGFGVNENAFVSLEREKGE